MIWAGTLTSMKYSSLNISTFKLLLKAQSDIQKAKGDGLTDQLTQEEEKEKKENEMAKGSTT